MRKSLLTICTLMLFLPGLAPQTTSSLASAQVTVVSPTTGQVVASLCIGEAASLSGVGEVNNLRLGIGGEVGFVADEAGGGSFVPAPDEQPRRKPTHVNLGWGRKLLQIPLNYTIQEDGFTLLIGADGEVTITRSST